MRGRSCGHHLERLVDAVAGLGTGGDVDAARRHVESCHRCRERLERTALIVVGLRRLHADLASVEPSPAAWECLQRRVLEEAGDRAVRHRTGLAFGLPALSALTACLLVAALGVPSLIGSAAPGTGSLGEGDPAVATAGGEGRIPLELVRPLGDGPAPFMVELLASDPADAVQPAARARAADACAGADLSAACATTSGPPSSGQRPTDRRR